MEKIVSTFVEEWMREGEARGEARGRAQGQAEGRAQGQAEGRAQGQAEGRAQGQAEGRAQGQAEGQAEICSRLLAHKFGPLPEEVQLRIRGATPEQLLAWSERILDAGTLEAVFDD
jgi:predicted transposase YdaD